RSPSPRASGRCSRSCSPMPVTCCTRSATFNRSAAGMTISAAVRSRCTSRACAPSWRMRRCAYVRFADSATCWRSRLMEAGNSLRASLIRRLMLPLIVVVIVAAAADYYLTVLPGLQAQDQELKKLSSLIAEFAAGTRDPRSISTYAERLFKPDSKVRTYYQVVDQDGHVITGSSLLAPVSAEFPLDEPKVFNSHVGDAPVRVAALKGKDLTVQVAETMGRREELVQHM